VAFLPLSAGLIASANLSTIVLMPRYGPRPLVAFGLLAAAGGAVWLAQLGTHTGYAAGVVGPIIVSGIGMGMVFAPAINAGTFGVAPQDSGVASATLTVGQMLGGSAMTWSCTRALVSGRRRSATSLATPQEWSSTVALPPRVARPVLAIVWGFCLVCVRICGWLV
jgi:hypothetical protein